MEQTTVLYHFCQQVRSLIFQSLSRTSPDRSFEFDPIGQRERLISQTRPVRLVKRPSHLTLAQLISGTVAIVFFALWWFLGNVSPYVVFLFFIVPILVLLSLFILWVVRRWTHRFRQQTVPKNCTICDELLPSAPLRQVRRVQGTHYRTVHPEAWRWSEKWRLPFVFIWISSVSLLVWAMYEIVARDYPPAFDSFAIVIALFFAMGFFTRRRRQYFRKLWQEQFQT